MRTVSTKAEFRHFLEQLIQTERLPVVAVSIPAGGTGTPPFPIERFEAEIGEGAHVWLLDHEATFWLTDELGKRLSVYSGWVRVYPSDPAWRAEERRAPLLQARPDPNRWLRAAVEAVLDVAYRDGYRPDVASTETTVREVVTVSGVLTATQVLVTTRGRRQAAMRTHHLWPGLPAERLVRPGQEFSGSIGSSAMLAEFVPEVPRQNVAARVRDFVGDGIVTLARATRVCSSRVELLVHPEYAVSVDDADVDLPTLVRPDEVVTIEIVPIDGSLVTTFSSDEPAPAMSVLPGGPPWLVREASEPEDVASAAAEDDERTLTSSEAWLYEEVERLEQQVRSLEAENRRLRRLERERSRISIPKVYDDPVAQLRLELHLAYLSRVK
ncbi:MAG TPA: hypothetical protein VM345_05600 [Acidimicrobiales bacterium]|jgi:hypothetical protein|nr:hypothetical protein [Acidimicrobiales bacterium]